MLTLYGKTRLSCEVNYGRSQEQGDCALTSLFMGDPVRPELSGCIWGGVAVQLCCGKSHLLAQ